MGEISVRISVRAIAYVGHSSLSMRGLLLEESSSSSGGRPAHCD